MPRVLTSTAAVKALGCHIKKVAARHHGNPGIVDQRRQRPQCCLGLIKYSGMVGDVGNVADDRRRLSCPWR